MKATYSLYCCLNMAKLTLICLAYVENFNFFAGKTENYWDIGDGFVVAFIHYITVNTKYDPQLRQFNLSKPGTYWLYMFTEAPIRESSNVRLELNNYVLMAYSSLNNGLNMPDANYGVLVASMSKVQSSLKLVTLRPTTRSYIAGLRLDNIFDSPIAFSLGCMIDSPAYLLKYNQIPVNRESLNKGRSWNVSSNSLKVRNEGIYYFSLTMHGPHGVIMYMNEKNIYRMQKTQMMSPQSVSLIQKLGVGDSVFFTALQNGQSKIDLTFNGFLYSPKHNQPRVAWLISLEFSRFFAGLEPDLIYNTVINEGGAWMEDKRHVLIGITGYYYIHINVVWSTPIGVKHEIKPVYVYSNSKLGQKTLLHVHTVNNTPCSLIRGASAIVLLKYKDEITIGNLLDTHSFIHIDLIHLQGFLIYVA